MTEQADFIKEIQAHAEAAATLLTHAAEYLSERDKNESNTQNVNPMRWLNEARTDLQKGFMCLKRAIDKPQGF